MLERWRRICMWLRQPEDAAALVVFRCALGLVMAIEAIRYLASGWVRAYYVDTTYLFKYMGFGWVQPMPLPGMLALFCVLLAAGLAMAVGLFYRVATLVLLVGYAYVFLLDATHYLNHVYLLLLLLTLMSVVPAERAVSVDVCIRPALARRRVPRWARALLVIQISLVYVFGGIAKLNPDWIDGRPIRQWMVLAARKAPMGAEVITSPWFTELVVWGGIAFDLSIVPLLLWKRTRILAVFASFAFHLTNAYLFDIGVFPWAMLVATTLFFAPSWPRGIPVVGRRLAAAIDGGREFMPPKHTKTMTAGSWAAAAWFTVQLCLPLRHHLYPGDVAWTEEGHYFSWRMKLRSKRGIAYFVITDPVTDERWRVDPRDELTHRQAAKMSAKPDLILQYAHHLAQRYGKERGRRVEVRADVRISLNYHPPRRLIDPEVDLAEARHSLLPSPWILR